MITIVDYGMGNLGSIQNMLKRIGHASQITSDPSEVARATRLILPGVGAFDAGMENLHAAGLVPVLNERVLAAGIPTLGICLGMQLMTERSEEGTRPGLGWLEAQALRFQPCAGAEKIPHMGWNLIAPARPSPLTEQLPEESRFYFVHSYFVLCAREQDVLMTASYGRSFHAAFQRDNIWGVQFHPEKSHKFGMQLLRNFAERCASC